jgi:large exoprotein involved in heme utilization and adhesion
MEHCTIVTVSIATDSSGDFTDTIAAPHGRLLQYRVVDTDLAAGTDLDLVGTVTGFVYINHDSMGSTLERSPRAPTHDVLGAASLYAGSGLAVEDYMYVAENLDLTIANGGDTKTGKLYLWFG